MTASPSKVLVLIAGFLAGWLVQNARPAFAAEPQSADLIVYGGTASGVIAAIERLVTSYALADAGEALREALRGRNMGAAP